MSYENLETKYKATWFIDPPYIDGGKCYKFNKIDYVKLAEWCKSLNGFAIVCENSNAKWLDFQHLTDNVGQIKTKSEGIWIGENNVL